MERSCYLWGAFGLSDRNPRRSGSQVADNPVDPKGSSEHISNDEEAIMTDKKMTAQIAEKRGFIAALDQSGGSTPGALRQYGIPDSAYSGDAEMFKLMHEMRVRIM